MPLAKVCSLHDYGIAHGRPALRYRDDPDTDSVMPSIGKNARRWPEFYTCWMGIYLFSSTAIIREGDLPNTHLYAAMNGYSSARCARETVLHVKKFRKRDYLFKFCRLLNHFTL